MSITPDNIIMATNAVYRGSERIDDGGCEYVLSFMVPTRQEAASIEAHVRANGNMAEVQLIALCSDADITGGVADSSAGRYAGEAQILRECGWLARPDVLAALGSDEEYHRWVSYQPSIVSGAHSETDDAGAPRNVPCHVRRAGEGGTGYKPPYAQVPMTNDEHHRQHNASEMAVYVRWQRLQGMAPLSMDRDDAMRWFDQRLAETRIAWAAEKLAEALGQADLDRCQPLQVFEWARQQGVPAPDIESPMRAGGEM